MVDLLEIKKKNSHFSHRYFALKASLPAYNYLKLVSDGKRNLTHNYLKKFIKGLSGKFRHGQIRKIQRDPKRGGERL